MRRRPQLALVRPRVHLALLLAGCVAIGAGGLETDRHGNVEAQTPRRFAHLAAEAAAPGGSWKAVDLGENDAKQTAMDLNVVFDQYGERTNADRREVRPPVPVESATWQAAGELDYWVREGGEWWGRVRDPHGHQAWIRAADLRRSPLSTDRSS